MCKCLKEVEGEGGRIEVVVSEEGSEKAVIVAVLDVPSWGEGWV